MKAEVFLVLRRCAFYGRNPSTQLVEMVVLGQGDVVLSSPDWMTAFSPPRMYLLPNGRIGFGHEPKYLSSLDPIS